MRQSDRYFLSRDFYVGGDESSGAMRENRINKSYYGVFFWLTKQFL